MVGILLVEGHATSESSLHSSGTSLLISPLAIINRSHTRLVPPRNAIVLLNAEVSVIQDPGCRYKDPGVSKAVDIRVQASRL